MCFRPKDVPSKKTLIVELDRARAGLEQENGILRARLSEAQEQLSRHVKERDANVRQRAELNAQLSSRSAQATQLLTRVTELRSSMQSFLRVLERNPCLHEKALTASQPAQSPGAVSVQVVQLECWEGGLGQGPATSEHNTETAMATPQRRANTLDDRASYGSAAGRSTAKTTSSEGLPVEQQIGRELGSLQGVYDSIMPHAMSLQEQLQSAQGNGAALRAEGETLRRRLEVAEANAAQQQDAMRTHTSALEQENEHLTDMAKDVQARLDTALAELAAGKERWSEGAEQLAKSTTDLDASTSRLRVAEAEVVALQSQLSAAQSRAGGAEAELQEAKDQATSRATALAEARTALSAREAEADALRVDLRHAEGLASHHRQLYEAVSAELHDVQAAERVAREALDAARTCGSAQQRELATAQAALGAKAAALEAASAQLQESQAALAAHTGRLGRAQEELAASEARAAEANGQYMASKQNAIATAKQLASMAKEHSAALARLHALEAEAGSLREHLAAATGAAAAATAHATEATEAARQARHAADVAGAEAARLRVAYDNTAAELKRKIMLLTAIARMANKGQAAGAPATRGRDGTAGQPDAPESEYYGAVTREPRLRLKVCEAPLPLLGALAAGIMDSSALRALDLDCDTSREVAWEKAGLRLVCLAAACGLNTSLHELQLGGWTWGEMGNGAALPFLALGGGGGGLAGGGGMLRSVRLSSVLFDVEAAAMLRDLLAAGLVELAPGPLVGQDQGQGEESGRQQGVLQLYSGHERLDGWYADMIRAAQRQQADPPAVDCDLSSEGLESHHCVLVLAVLATCPGLRRLRLDGNKIGDGGAAVLALGVGAAAAAGLRELGLSRNGLRSGGARSLGRCLEGHAGLRRLDLSAQRFEGLGPAGAEALAAALRANRSLEELNLASCGLGGAAAACFAGAIRAAGALRPAPSTHGGDSHSRPSTAASARSGSSGSGGGGGCSGGSGSLALLVLSGNGMDAATASALIVAAADRPGLSLVLS